jgi:hypothetical protein
MAVKLHYIKNAQSPIGSIVEAIPVGSAEVSITLVGAECRAALKSRGMRYIGKGESTVLALQDLAATITKAAIKKERRGRPSDRCRLAASLLHGGPS